jgi:hypothetical protein
MRHESKFSTRIRSGGQSAFVLGLNGLVDLETKFSVVPDRLLDSIIDDALAAAVGHLNQYLPDGVWTFHGGTQDCHLRRACTA